MSVRFIVFVFCLLVCIGVSAKESEIRKEIESSCIYAAAKQGASQEQSLKQCRCYFESFAEHVTLREYVEFEESESLEKGFAYLVGSRGKLIKADIEACMSR
jgi:hypothetical protein